MRSVHSKDESLRAVYSCLEHDSVDEMSRARVRRRVLEALSPPAHTALHRRFGWVASLAAAAAAVVLAVFAVRMAENSLAPRVEPKLSIHANGGVHLQWNDVGKARYRVLRSTNPADLSDAPRATVRGTEFVDHEPLEARVIYYRVE